MNEIKQNKLNIKISMLDYLQLMLSKIITIVGVACLFAFLSFLYVNTVPLSYKVQKNIPAINEPLFKLISKIYFAGQEFKFKQEDVFEILTSKTYHQLIFDQGDYLSHPTFANEPIEERKLLLEEISSNLKIEKSVNDIYSISIVGVNRELVGRFLHDLVTNLKKQVDNRVVGMLQKDLRYRLLEISLNMRLEEFRRKSKRDQEVRSLKDDLKLANILGYEKGLDKSKSHYITHLPRWVVYGSDNIKKLLSEYEAKTYESYQLSNSKVEDEYKYKSILNHVRANGILVDDNTNKIKTTQVKSKKWLTIVFSFFAGFFLSMLFIFIRFVLSVKTRQSQIKAW